MARFLYMVIVWETDEYHDAIRLCCFVKRKSRYESFIRNNDLEGFLSFERYRDGRVHMQRV